MIFKISKNFTIPKFFSHNNSNLYFLGSLGRSGFKRFKNAKR